LEGDVAYFGLENFNKIIVYLDYLRDPTAIQGSDVRHFKMGGIKMNEMLLAFVIT